MSLSRQNAAIQNNKPKGKTVNAEVQKLVVEKINEIRKKNAENQIASLAAQIVNQLDYANTQNNQAKLNIEGYRKQIDNLNGTIVKALTAEEIFGKEQK